MKLLAGEYDCIVEDAWQAVEKQRVLTRQVVNDLWELKYKAKYKANRVPGKTDGPQTDPVAVVSKITWD
jgi:5,10-methenyltetrahydromethanopterin hydrogenase